MNKVILILFLLSISIFDESSQTKAEIRKEARKKEKERKKQEDERAKAFYDSGATPPNPQPGKCYTKYMVPDTTTKKVRFSSWEEVICGDKITPSLVTKIVEALKSKGYDVDTTATILTKEIKIEISKFQKDFNLPLVPLNIKTLDALGIRY